MAIKNKKDLKVNPKREVKESSAIKSKTPTVSANQVKSEDQSFSPTVKADVNLSKVNGSTLEKYTLVEGRQDYDASVSVIDNINYLNLPVPNVAANTTPQESREGGKLIRDFSTFSKVYKARVANVVKGGHFGIAETPAHPVNDAMARATGSVLKHNVASLEPIIPDACNFAMYLNVSGHLPKSFISKVTEWEDHQVYGLRPRSFENANRKGLKEVLIRQQQVLNGNPNNLVEFINDNHLTINSRNVDNQFFGEFRNIVTPFNVAELNTNYNNAFNMDIDTHNFFTDLTKVAKNLNEITDSKMDNIPSIIKTEEFIYTKIMNDIDFATFMYIMIDSWKCNLDYVNFLGEKFGIIDNTIRSMFVSSTQDRRLLNSRLSNIMTIFDSIPVNSRVIDEWNRVKLASSIGNSDKFSEGSMLLIPHFKLAFASFDHDDDVLHANVSASANTTSIRVPLDNILNRMFNATRRYNRTAVVQHRNEDSFYATGNDRVQPYASINPVTSNFSVSAVRLTNESLNLLKDVLYGEFWGNIASYFTRNYRYYNLLNISGAFADTSFKYLKPQVPDFASRSTSDAQFVDKLVHIPYLSTLNPHYAGIDMIPVIDSNTIKNDHDFTRQLRHYITFDRYSDAAYIQKFLKAVVVEGFQHENENVTNGIVDNDINANLVCYNLASSVIIPLSGDHHFNMNINPISRSNSFTATKGINQRFNEMAMLFEYFAWGSNKNSGHNTSMTMPHIGGYDLANSSYFVADTLAAFMLKATPRALASLYESLSIPFPKTQFYCLDLEGTVDIAGPFGFNYPSYNTYIPYWTYRPFADHSSNDVLGFNGKYLSLEDLLINKVQ